MFVWPKHTEDSEIVYRAKCSNVLSLYMLMVKPYLTLWRT